MEKLSTWINKRKLILVKSLLLLNVAFSTCTHSLLLILSTHPHPDRCAYAPSAQNRALGPAARAERQQGKAPVASSEPSCRTIRRPPRHIKKVAARELVGLTPSRGHSRCGWLSFLTPGRCGAQTKGQPESDRWMPRSSRRPQLLLISTKPPSRQFSVSGGS